MAVGNPGEAHQEPDNPASPVASQPEANGIDSLAKCPLTSNEYTKGVSETDPNETHRLDNDGIATNSTAQPELDKSTHGGKPSTSSDVNDEQNLESNEEPGQPDNRPATSLPAKTKNSEDDDDEDRISLALRVEEELEGKARDNLPQRRLEARQQLYQGVSYSALIEDRIVELEEELSSLKSSVAEKLGEARPKSPADGVSATPSSEDEPSKLTGAARMNWQEYGDDEKVSSRTRAHVVEYLVETPPTLQQRHESSAVRRRQRDAVRSGHEQQSKVERMRINSTPICEVLAEIMGKDAAPTTGTSIIRPFKCILAFWDELSNRTKELQTEADTKAADKGAESTTCAPSDNDSTGHRDQTDVAAQESTTLADNTSGESSSALPTATGTLNATDQVVETVESASADPTPHSNAAIKLEHLQTLLAAVNTELSEELATHREHRDRKRDTVQFHDLWHLFAPGDVVWNTREAQAYRLLSVHNGREILTTARASKSDEAAQKADLLASMGRGPRNPFVIDYFSIDFDGNAFGPLVSKISIEPFSGERQVTELDLYPLFYAKTSPGGPSLRAAALDSSIPLRDALLKRGRFFRRLANAKHMKHCEYRGMTMDVKRELVDSRVIIDMSYYYESHTFETPDLRLIGSTTGDAQEIRDQCFCGNPDCTIAQIKFHDDRKVEDERMTNFVNENSDWLGDNRRKHSFNEDDQLVLMPGKIWGFILYSREWHLLDVNKVLDVAESDESFRQLQISTEYKRLVESQVSMHSRGIKPAMKSPDKPEDENREDLVRGKGKGLIILLHGVPGVGKTSTAECVAEYTNRPLLSITCGDIGDNANDVQKNLENYLNLAHRWGCVMLLDEADVFLAIRSRHDMHRNAVVSVFLRILEYYSGILFLTTNKIGVVDEAFKSRIHLSLYYPPLNERQTTKIWETCLQRIKKNKPKVTYDEGEILEWASQQWRMCDRKGSPWWNGRQIRNACQTITALAEFDSEGKIDGEIKISMTHLSAVKQASSDFDRYLYRLYGGDDAYRAKKQRDRRDDYQLRSGMNYNPRDDDDSGYRPYDRNERYAYDHERSNEYNESARDRRPSGRDRRGARSPAKPRRDARSPSYERGYDDDEYEELIRRPSMPLPRGNDVDAYGLSRGLDDTELREGERPRSPIDDSLKGRAGQRYRPEPQYRHDEKNGDRASRR